MGCAASGAQDANSFHAAVRAGRFLPTPSSITYQGIFNQHSYYAGPPEKQDAVALASRIARVPFVEGQETNKDVWVGCFLKSCRDGQPRDGTPIDMVVVLDISGSMQGGLGGCRDGRSRLELAKEAIEGLLSKLQGEDRFGLATFTTQGAVIQPLEFFKKLDRDSLSQRIQQLRAGGGTTLAAGMDAAVGSCQDSAEPEGPRHRRLLFLTDMNDCGSSQLDQMIASQAEHGLYVSFVGIGMDFNSELADQVTRHRGANYFCITRDEELRKVVVDDFDWNFFPAAFEVEVAQQSDAFDLVGVYGTPFDTQEETTSSDWKPDNHKFYPPEFKEHAKELLLCSLRQSPQAIPSPALQTTLSFLSPEVRTIIRVDTVFPSAVDDDASVEGGLILLRMRPRTAMTSAGIVRLMLRYLVNGTEMSTSQDVEIPAETSAVEQMPQPDLAVEKGVMLQRYVEVCRRFLSKAQQSGRKNLTELHVALASVNALLAEFENSPDKTDALCPGVRDSLNGFAEMAEAHCNKNLPHDMEK